MSIDEGIEIQTCQKQVVDYDILPVAGENFCTSSRNNDIVPPSLDRMISCEDNLKESIASLSLDDTVLNSFLEVNKFHELTNQMTEKEILFCLATRGNKDTITQLTDTEYAQMEINSFQSRRDVYQKMLNQDASDTSAIAESTISSGDTTSLNVLVQGNIIEVQAINSDDKTDTKIDLDEIPYDEIDPILCQREMM